ncbi:NAD(P)-dependent oxidoreductase [Saccharopolyspora sp. MS10]|uniref:NAD(P)-dependent oxidoreductase n=1 Tax=Saccharopolyspora sp. MS10 TaxID=3385973 RepID=UPI0039A12EF7
MAVLGTGDAGFAMAQRLRERGFGVRAWNRTPERAAPLADEGVQVLPTPAEAVRSADLVLVVVFDVRAVLDVLERITPALEPGAVVLQSATVGAEITEVVTAATRLGVAVVDAPFLGNPGPARRGELTYLVAGEPGHKDVARPMLDALASNVVDVADRPGGASLLKLTCNTWLFGLNAVAAQASVLAESFGLDPALFLRAVSGSNADSTYLHYRAEQLTGRSEEVLSPVRAALKDLGHIRSAASRAAVPDQLLAVLHGIYAGASEAGLADRDLAAVREVLAP